MLECLDSEYMDGSRDTDRMEISCQSSVTASAPPGWDKAFSCFNNVKQAAR